jgi:hypothetical protein
MNKPIRPRRGKERGRLNTVDLLVKVACFVNNIFKIKSI